MTADHGDKLEKQITDYLMRRGAYSTGPTLAYCQSLAKDIAAMTRAPAAEADAARLREAALDGGEWREKLAHQCGETMVALKRAESAEARIADAARLREALVKYGQHENHCDTTPQSFTGKGKSYTCTCGLTEALTKDPGGES